MTVLLGGALLEVVGAKPLLTFSLQVRKSDQPQSFSIFLLMEQFKQEWEPLKLVRRSPQSWSGCIPRRCPAASFADKRLKTLFMEYLENPTENK